MSLHHHFLFYRVTVASARTNANLGRILVPSDHMFVMEKTTTLRDHLLKMTISSMILRLTRR